MIDSTKQEGNVECWKFTFNWFYLIKLHTDAWARICRSFFLTFYSTQLKLETKIFDEIL